MCKSVEDALIQCPYYKDENGNVIRCEGVEEETCLHLSFSSRYDRKAYKDRFCRNGWKNCMIAKMLNLKYDYEP